MSENESPREDDYDRKWTSRLKFRHKVLFWLVFPFASSIAVNLIVRAYQRGFIDRETLSKLDHLRLRMFVPRWMTKLWEKVTK